MHTHTQCPTRCFTSTPVSSTVHSENMSPSMQALELTKDAAVDPRPDGRICYPVQQFRAVLRETASGQHILSKGLLVVKKSGEFHVAYADLGISIALSCRKHSLTAFPSTVCPIPLRCEKDSTQAWQLRLPESTAKMQYHCLADGPEEHSGLDIVQDLRCAQTAT